MPTVTLLNQKGGVGKTSCTYHLAGALSALGRRVLLVDNDPQSSLTQGFFGPVYTRAIDPAETVAGVYSGDSWPATAIRPTPLPRVDLLPGSRRAASANVPDPQLADWSAQVALREFLAQVADGYDLVLIDCPPNLHLCSWAALVASDAIVVPLQPEDFGAQGIADVSESIDLVRAAQNPGLKLLGYLITMVNNRLAVHKSYENLLRGTYLSEVFATTIPLSTDFKEAVLQHQPVSLYKPRGVAAKAVRALAEEIGVRLAGEVLGRTEAA